MSFQNKKVLVVGAARSGVAAAALLDKLGADVTLYDNKSFEQLGTGIAELTNSRVKLHLGSSPDELVRNQQLIVVSPGVPLSLPLFDIAKKFNVEVFSEIELAYCLTPCPVIAITGTNGKTTTTALTGDIIRNMTDDVFVVGNIGVPYSSAALKLTRKSLVVVEVSSFQLETINKFHPRITAVLNISPDHLDRHLSLDNYVSIKERIFKNQDNYDFCILNYDDPICFKMSIKTNANVFFFSVSHPLSKGIFLRDNYICVKWGSIDTELININELKILGMHNVQNAMAAIAISICAGVSLSDIKSALVNFKGVAHRIEYVDTINNIEFYNDSKGTNPDSSIRAILAMQRPIILIAGGYDKNSDFDKFVYAFYKRVKFLVVIGQTSDKIISTAQKYGFFNFCKADSLEEATKIAFANALPYDCVLLSPACASWDMFSDYEQRGLLFCKIVNNLRK